MLKNLIIGMLVGLCLPVQALAQTINNQQNAYYPADAVNPQSSTYGGSTYAGELYNNTQGEGAQQFRESGFVSAVSTVANANACLGVTGAGLTMTPTACVAYDAGFRNAETGSITFPSNGTYWVAIDSCSQTGPPTSLCTQSNPGLSNFTRVSGTHYLIDGIDVNKPTMATNSQLLMKVVASGGAITAVTDERTLTPNNLGGGYSGPVQITGNQTNGTDQINSVSLNGTCNPDTFGAVHDGVTDDSAAFRSCITQLGSVGGTVAVSRHAYAWGSEVLFPRNVILQGEGPDASQINCTFTTGACAVWADNAAVNAYHRGGANQITINGPGTGDSIVGVFTGGDPANVIAPSGDYADMLTFINVKVQFFGTGWEQGNNSWEVRWYSPVITSNATGVLIPSTGIQTGENDAIFGGAVQNANTGIFCDNQNTDFYIHSVSLDGIAGTAIKDGDGTNGGCTFQSEGSHIEYFSTNIHPLAAPILYVYGPTTFTSLFWHGGVIQVDDDGVTAGTVESLAKVGGGSTNATLDIDRVRVASNRPITWSGSCVYGNNAALPQMCIESDGAQFIVPGYVWWDLSNSGTFPTSLGNQYFTDPSGSSFFHFTDSTGGVSRWTLNSGVSGSSQGNFSLHDDVANVFPLIIAPTTDLVTVTKNMQVGGFLNSQTGANSSGGGSVATGSNAMWGRITGCAATGNVITPGFTCANDVECNLTDDTTAGGAKGTAQSTTTFTFSATASDTVTYSCGCR